MICPPCRRGGKANQLANDRGEDEFVASLQRLARRYHERCTGCDCHHFVGQALNKQLVRPE